MNGSLVSLIDPRSALSFRMTVDLVAGCCMKCNLSCISMLLSHHRFRHLAGQSKPVFCFFISSQQVKELFALVDQVQVNSLLIMSAQCINIE